MMRTTCGNCGSTDLLPFLDLGMSPLADILPATSEEVVPTYPLGLLVCQKCWLTQLSYVVPDDALYNDDYAYYTGVSKADYHKDLARRLAAEFRPEFVVEIGSNDGDLLQHFKPARVLGIDPSTGPAAVAEEREIDTWDVPFTQEVARQVRVEMGLPDLVIANHVAAHVSDLHDLFAGIATLIDPVGVASLEVQYVGDLLTGNQFDNVYHQHRFFFNVGSLDTVARAHGMQVIRVRAVEAQGGSIHVLLAKHNPLYPVGTPHENWLEHQDAYVGFQGRVDRVRDRLLMLLADEQRHSRRVVGYGAPAKATTLLSYCGIDRHLVSALEDTTPYKISRTFPGTQIPVVRPGESGPVDTYLLTVWNYLPKVIRREARFLADGGHIITPIPLPVRL